MVEFKRNKKTGKLEAYKNGKRVGSVGTMGDEVKKENDRENKKQRKRSSIRYGKGD